MIRQKRRRLILMLLTALVAVGIAATSRPAQGQTPAPAPTQVSLRASMQQGQALMRSERYAEAAQVWQQLAQSQPQQAAIAFSYLAVAQQSLAQWDAAQASLVQGLGALHQAPTDAARGIRARLLNAAGQQALSQGQPEVALEQWQAAAAAYEADGDITGQIGSQINQAIALQSLGFYRRSRRQLEALQPQLQEQAPVIRATGLRQLGVAYRLTGDLPQAQSLLEASLEAMPQPNTRLSLGHVLLQRGEDDAALQQYQRAYESAQAPALRLSAQVSELQLLIESNPDEARALAGLLPPQLTAAGPSRPTVFARVSLAQALMQLAGDCPAASCYLEALEQLKQATTQSRQLQDKRAESFALGTLGLLYQQAGQWADAETVTADALRLAQSLKAQDLTAQWQRQRGKIALKQGRPTQAIAAYQAAAEALHDLRQDLAAVGSDVQFSFTRSVEPVYRELIQLLLATPAKQVRPTQGRLRQTLDVLEDLKLAELDNFFRQACLTATSQPLDSIDPAAAIIYPIILPDRLAVIVARPQRPLLYHETRLPQAETLAHIEQLRLYLNPVFLDETRLQLSQTLYQWLLGPVDSSLRQQGIKTLVFVPDGPLNNLPMAALHDGERYVIETYGVAIAPSLKLIDPQQLERSDIQVLAAGISEPRLGFSPLPEVETELAQIQQETEARLLLNRSFTQDALLGQVSRRSPVVHLATHGQFGATTEETFLLAWDGVIDIDTLSLLIEPGERRSTPIELLVLSACQTATGDEQTVLGLSGLAVRSGARSTLGTLWQVGDRSTAMVMATFYREFTGSTQPKVEALRQAQLQLLNTPDFAHPFYWSAYVMVGNWL